MISKLNIAFKTAGGLRVLACAVLVVLIVFSSVGSTLEAQQGAEPLRKPPFEAIAACEGKKEGEPCTFNSPHGILNGDCMVGVENMFGCRPHRAPRTWPPAEPVSLNGKPWQYAGVLISCLAAAIISALLTWYGFFRYSILPLRRLRKVTQQLADGDLSARVGEGLVHQKNEVVELGRDVDRMAERIETLVGAHKRLIRDVSHELRSPLSRLNVALELARQSAGPALSAPFDRIERESNRLNELISQMLTLTRLENENGTIKMIPLDIAALVEEIARDVDFEAKSNGCSVVVTSESSPLILNGNREMLRQALENLLLNAIRYTAKGTSVDISLFRKESVSRVWARIEIRDHGPGVPELELKDIFRPFYRVNEAHERQSGGAGVGLAIADRAVYLHGGRLRAFNVPGAGLVMKMDLPLK